MPDFIDLPINKLYGHGGSQKPPRQFQQSEPKVLKNQHQLLESELLSSHDDDELS